jgi:hypothetical protein
MAMNSKETKKPLQHEFQGLFEIGAGNEARTRDLNLGKVALYQLSYSRISEARIICQKIPPTDRHSEFVLRSWRRHEASKKTGLIWMALSLTFARYGHQIQEDWCGLDLRRLFCRRHDGRHQQLGWPTLEPFELAPIHAAVNGQWLGLGHGTQHHVALAQVRDAHTCAIWLPGLPWHSVTVKGGDRPDDQFIHDCEWVPK